MKNYIVKIENGKPVIYGDVGNEDDGTAPVYIFETEEAYDAAVADGLIPVGSLVVKTYDAVEMAGGPFDAALSTESENAVQNKIIAAQVARLDQAIADAVALRASLTGFGMGKITPVDVTDITEADGRVLGGFEKNPAVAGSLAYGIANKTIKIDELLSHMGSTGSVDSYTTQALNGNISNYAMLCFVIGYLGYAVEDAVTIPISRFSYESASVNLSIGNSVASNIRFKTATSVDVSNTHDNRRIHIYGIKV